MLFVVTSCRICLVLYTEYMLSRFFLWSSDLYYTNKTHLTYETIFDNITAMTRYNHVSLFVC
jgi:hypothetical protein